MFKKRLRFSIANSLPHPPKSMLNLAKFFSESPRLSKKHLRILGKRGFFTKKEIFYFAATDLSKIAGYGHSCKKYVFDICLYRARLDFAFYYFLALKFIENLHKLQTVTSLRIHNFCICILNFFRHYKFLCSINFKAVFNMTF